MTRPIKFRAWDRKCKKMFPVHEMTFAKIAQELDYIHGVDIYDKSSDFSGDVAYGGNIHKMTANFPRYELMQFTGLYDKNGVEVYSGDIYDIGICTKVIRPEHFIEDAYELMKLLDDGAVIEIISNIHDNPSLLEVQP